MTMVPAEIMHFAVGIFGNFTAFFLFLSPLPTFIQICKKKTVGQYSPVPYLLAFFNCMFWSVYGLPSVHPHSTLILTVNGTGVVVEFAYLMMFVIFSDKKKRLYVILVIIIEIAIVGASTASILNFVHDIKDRLKVVGLIGVVTCTTMYASPLSVMKLVIMTKSVEFMPLSLSLATFANSLIWTVYGIRPFDRYLVAPNALGSVFGAVQLILYGIYYRSTQKQIEERNLKNTQVLDLAQVVVDDGGGSKMNNQPAAADDQKNNSTATGNKVISVVRLDISQVEGGDQKVYEVVL